LAVVQSDWTAWLLVAVLSAVVLLLLVLLVEIRSYYMTRGRRGQLYDLHAEWHVLNPDYPKTAVHLVSSYREPTDWQSEGWFGDTAEVPVQPAPDGDTLDSP
jgi:hypothetical protein